MPIMSMQQEFSSLVCSAGVGLAAFSAKTVASGIAVAVIAANRKFVFMFLPFVSVLVSWNIGIFFIGHKVNAGPDQLMTLYTQEYG